MKTIENILSSCDISAVDFGYARFSITFVEDLKEDGEACWGATDLDKYEIRIERNMPVEMGADVLLHEITHIILNLVGFGGYPSNHGTKCTIDGLVPETTNEFMTETLSNGIKLSMNLNKKLYRALWVNA